jgi:hypothetical protein
VGSCRNSTRLAVSWRGEELNARAASRARGGREPKPRLGAMENPSPEISVAELREAIRRLLGAVEQRFGPTVPLGIDGYSVLFAPEMFAADGSEPEVTGRSLSDDVASIREVVERVDQSEDELLLWHDLNHLVGILQRISALAS